MTTCRVTIAVAALWALLLTNIQSQSVRRVQGYLTGIASGWVGAVVSIPYLRIGTIAGDRGTFRLVTTASEGCYEMVIRATGARTTYYRFHLTPTDSVNLGAIPVRPLPLRPDIDIGEHTRPVPSDTVGDCRPGYASVPESWATGSASIVGHISRGAYPLRGATVDLYCSNGLGSARAVSDSHGLLTFALQLTFPQEQALANGAIAQCQLTHRLVDIDSPYSIVVRFGSPDQPSAAVTEFSWDLPEPHFELEQVVAPALSFPGAIRLPPAALHIGVLAGPQMVIFAFVATPAQVTFIQQGTYYCPGPNRVWGWDGCRFTPGAALPPDSLHALPISIRVATGGKRPTTGSSIDLALPAQLVSPDGQRSLVAAYARVPLRFSSGHLFRPLPQWFDPALHALHIDFLSDVFDDERDSSDGNEAWIVLAAASMEAQIR